MSGAAFVLIGASLIGGFIEFIHIIMKLVK